ncbi:hypothetical protein CEXT_447791 [Caerostris extrusa]|uniref:Secreted protein n=1 Tax=Caerostris extrusa TaxID=172846 RepID=A0AAV4V9D3_CAEEX|nr:hypothetical protein CEXT_447791 [Caerostris extrusa]
MYVFAYFVFACAIQTCLVRDIADWGAGVSSTWTSFASSQWQSLEHTSVLSLPIDITLKVCLHWVSKAPLNKEEKKKDPKRGGKQAGKPPPKSKKELFGALIGRCGKGDMFEFESSACGKTVFLPRSQFVSKVPLNYVTKKSCKGLWDTVEEGMKGRVKKYTTSRSRPRLFILFP